MTQTNATASAVEVMWRPGCPFCRSLRRGLSRAGVATTEHNIWSSADAAARVRKATGGDETVPTVFVGDRALVNPTVRQVVDAIKAADPEDQPLPGSAARAGSAGRKPPSAGLIWTLVVAVVWLLLAVWRPTTTWHLAPLILAATWPWFVGQDATAHDPSARRRIVFAAGGGIGVAWTLTAVLTLAGRLSGPTWTGTGSPVVEALVLALGGSAVALAMGLLRTVRRTMSASARLGTSHIVTSDDIVMVEGNAYFPVSGVPKGVLHHSSTTSVCPWKGIASYYNVHVNGQVVPDGAFTYRHPSPLARRIKGRVAFWNGIDVDSPAPTSSTVSN